MSKYVKNLVTDYVREQLSGVGDAILVDVIGMNANANNRLRGVLEEKNINLLVVKNSLAARAMTGTPLAGMFDGFSGSAAVCWGGEDIVSLAKEVARLADDAQYAPFAPRGGMMDGDRLDANQVVAVSKWPNREEQLSILVGQILSPGANLASQLNSPGGALASQVAQKGESSEEGDSSSES